MKRVWVIAMLGCVVLLAGGCGNKAATESPAPVAAEAESTAATSEASEQELPVTESQTVAPKASGVRKPASGSGTMTGTAGSGDSSDKELSYNSYDDHEDDYDEDEEDEGDTAPDDGTAYDLDEDDYDEDKDALNDNNFDFDELEHSGARAE